MGVSRLAHPACLGGLAVAKHTGAKFNPIPLSGGKKTRSGVATGEMDLGALPSGVVLNSPKSFKVVMLTSHKNPFPAKTDDAPTINGHFKTNLPSLIAGARAFGIKKSALTNHPDRYKVLETTLKKVFEDPAFKETYLKTGSPWELVGYRGPEECIKYGKEISKIGEDFKELLSGK